MTLCSTVGFPLPLQMLILNIHQRPTNTYLQSKPFLHIPDSSDYLKETKNWTWTKSNSWSIIHPCFGHLSPTHELVVKSLNAVNQSISFNKTSRNKNSSSLRYTGLMKPFLLKYFWLIFKENESNCLLINRCSPSLGIIEKQIKILIFWL